MEKLNIDQVAELAYVSRSVVSRVLNNHPNVSDEARERVLKVIEEYDYRPSSVARSLATDRTFEICILTPRRGDEALANGFWTLLHLGIFEECIRRGYFVSLSMISAGMESEINDRILKEHKFDGYVLITQEVVDLVGPALRKQERPTVLVGHDPDYPDLNSIDVDNFRGAYKAVSHLCDLGHERIGAIWGSPDMQESVDRQDGFRQALEDASRPVLDDWIAVGDYSQQNGLDTMNAWIERGIDVSAVFCASDTIAMGALLALHKAGANVPGDVAIVGFDDLPTSQYIYPPLTTVRQPIYEKGERAASILIDHIEQEEEAEIVHANLEPDLVVRESCGAA